jgi:hypothetical protein
MGRWLGRKDILKGRDWAVAQEIPEQKDERRKAGGWEIQGALVEASNIWVPSSKTESFIRLQIAPAADTTGWSYHEGGGPTAIRHLKINAWSPDWQQDNNPDESLVEIKFTDGESAIGVGGTRLALSVFNQDTDGGRDATKYSTIIIGSNEIFLGVPDGAGNNVGTNLVIDSDGVLAFDSVRSLPFAFPHVRKTANEDVTNSTVLQDDNHLLFEVATNEIFAFECFIMFTSASATPDLKLTFVGPAGSTVWWQPNFSTDPTVAGALRIAGGTTAVFQCDGNARTALIKGIIVNGATAGDLKLQWAQNTANLTATTVLANSYLLAHRIKT